MIPYQENKVNFCIHRIVLENKKKMRYTNKPLEHLILHNEKMNIIK